MEGTEIYTYWQTLALQDALQIYVVGLSGRTFAIVEAGGKPAELSDTLGTIAHNPFDGTLAGPYTAHPHHDPFANETHALTYQGDRPNMVWHVVLDADAHVIREEADRKSTRLNSRH